MSNFIRKKIKPKKGNDFPTFDFFLEGNQIVKKENVDIILNYIDSFLYTEKGSLFGNREFGTSIYSYLYEPLDEVTLNEIYNILLNELSYSLPMIDINNITLTPFIDEKGLEVNIYFTFDKQRYKIDRKLNLPLKRL